MTKLEKAAVVEFGTTRLVAVSIGPAGLIGTGLAIAVVGIADVSTDLSYASTRQ